MSAVVTQATVEVKRHSLEKQPPKNQPRFFVVVGAVLVVVVVVVVVVGVPRSAVGTPRNSNGSHLLRFRFQINGNSDAITRVFSHFHGSFLKAGRVFGLFKSG